MYYTRVVTSVVVVLDFGSSKSGSGQISSQIWWMPMQLQYVELIVDETTAADLSSGVFAILISVTPTKKIREFIVITQILSITGKQ